MLTARCALRHLTSSLVEMRYRPLECVELRKTKSIIPYLRPINNVC